MRYRWTVASLVKRDSRVAAIQFGTLLHGIQDFYAHSAWVDPAPIGLGFGHARAPLVETGTGQWSLPAAYRPLRDDIVVIQGNPPPGVTVELPPQSAVPVVMTGGTRYRGLMTSTAGPISFATAQCPPVGDDCWSASSVCIRHAEPRREPEGADEIQRCQRGSPEIFDNCFHHDDPRRPRHNEAVSAAIRQTAHEWCRLLNLADSTDTSGTAVSFLLTLWVRPPAEMPRLASAHPVGTPCGPDGRITRTVVVELPRVSDSAADHFVAALYTTDLRRSNRVQFEADQLPPAPLKLAISGDERVVLSVWGWKGKKAFGSRSEVTSHFIRPQ